MIVRAAISKAVETIYGDHCPNVYKGTDFDGVIQATGWWYKPFNSRPIYLGKSKTEALEMLEQIAEERSNIH
jgi:hypothetical protein